MPKLIPTGTKHRFEYTFENDLYPSYNIGCEDHMHGGLMTVLECDDEQTAKEICEFLNSKVVRLED